MPRPMADASKCRGCGDGGCYENRNDATTSLELQKIGQSYIKYKGTPEIKLTIKSENNVWNVGDRVYFNAPITELKTEYMVRSKKTNYIYTANTIKAILHR